ncbi:hypothetical protein Hypma_015010 [Hypsizygus marmoreus]|uniref:Uncharacterized protein n=1 Tax=Hypsizygus marmoreus TaxID=39966 RepID=A0A369K271_HYPMA|nr:hypothetical protein Hypma_015010 [Hypsizygus marmoreus]
MMHNYLQPKEANRKFLGFKRGEGCEGLALKTWLVSSKPLANEVDLRLGGGRKLRINYGCLSCRGECYAEKKKKEDNEKNAADQRKSTGRLPTERPQKTNVNHDELKENNETPLGHRY